MVERERPRSDDDGPEQQDGPEEADLRRAVGTLKDQRLNQQRHGGEAGEEADRQQDGTDRLDREAERRRDHGVEGAGQTPGPRHGERLVHDEAHGSSGQERLREPDAGQQVEDRGEGRSCGVDGGCGGAGGRMAPARPGAGPMALVISLALPRTDTRERRLCGGLLGPCAGSRPARQRACRECETHEDGRDSRVHGRRWIGPPEDPDVTASPAADGAGSLCRRRSGSRGGDVHTRARGVRRLRGRSDEGDQPVQRGGALSPAANAGPARATSLNPESQARR